MAKQSPHKKQDDYPLSPEQLWSTLWGGGGRIEDYVVFRVRMPRLAMALVVGAALGIAGALLPVVVFGWAEA